MTQVRSQNDLEPHLHDYQGLQSTFSTQVYSIPHSHNGPLAHLHDHQILQSSCSTQEHNLTDNMNHWQATGHVNTGQLLVHPPFPDYYFQGYSMPVDTYQRHQVQENVVVNAVTNNSDNMFLSLNDPTSESNTGG